MTGPSKVIVLAPEARASHQLMLGLAREGVAAAAVVVPTDGALTLPADAGVVVVGGADGAALDLVRKTRAQLADTPIVFAGDGGSRDALHAAGADEVLARPVFLRDVVTVAKILTGVPKQERDHLVGSLVDTTGVFTLVRAFAAMGRSAVLTLIRGLRRGEVRFFHGEVTSAQVGLIHGQAALHQLLLWTDARFDYAHEDIVRRQQIPLSSEELFADAERFLDGVRESAGGLSPAMVLEQDVARVHNLGKQIPTEVHGVLRMFDGHRMLADILEDSPYRVFETLRVAGRAVEFGLLKVVQSQRPKSTWRAVLAIEEWLVGKETRDAVVERTQQLDSGPVAPGGAAKPAKKKKRGKRAKLKTPDVGATPLQRPEIDWGALVPRVIGAEVGPLSGVVPAAAQHGEIEVATRSAPREKLEALMDTDKREKIFPTDIGLEPSIVVGQSSGDTEEWERVESEARARVESEAAAEAAAAGAAAAATRAQDSVDRMQRARLTREKIDAIAKPDHMDDPATAAASAAAAIGAEVVKKQTAPVTIAETESATVMVAETMTVTAAGDTAVVTSQQQTMIVDKPPSEVVKAPPPASKTSEITTTKMVPLSAPKSPEPSILSDLAAAHSAIAAAMVAEPIASAADAGLVAVPAPVPVPVPVPAPVPVPVPAAAAPPDIASPSRELAVSETRRDALAATDAEAAFFNRSDVSAKVVKIDAESFADLDEGYQPTGFWTRVFGKKPPTPEK